MEAVLARLAQPPLAVGVRGQAVPGVHALPVPAELVGIPLCQGLLQPVRGGCGQRFERGA